MWHFRLKYQRIGASVKASHKWLNAFLVSGIKNFGLVSIVSKLVKFLFFDNFFFDLVKFRDLDIFLLFDFSNLDNFSNFLMYSIPFSIILNSSTSLLPSFLLETHLLSLFILETDFLLLFLLETDLSSDLIVLNIEVSGAAILLKP